LSVRIVQKKQNRLNRSTLPESANCLPLIQRPFLLTFVYVHQLNARVPNLMSQIDIFLLYDT